jgi:hypothetical protein
MIFRGALALSAVMAVASSAFAQAAPQAPRTDDPARPQVQTFEMVLSRALEVAGRNFAARATEIAPQLTAMPTGDNPQVTGVAVRDLNLYVFHVQVPGIDLSLSVMNLMVNRPQFAGRSEGPQPQPVNGRVESTGVVAPDPMGPAAPRPTLLDFRVVYQTQVRDALVDAIVDNAAALPLGANDALLVIAGGIDPPVTNPLYRRTSHRLVLRAKGADLLAFREGRITRDEVKQRVLASDF